jgi:hypothetical protein
MHTRKAIGFALALTIAISACGNNGTGGATPATATTPTTPRTTTTALPRLTLPTVAPTDMEGVLVRLQLFGGECDRCDYRVEFGEDGVASYSSPRGDTVAEYDADALRALVAPVDPATLVIGVDDCGREVDGNAEVITLRLVELDLCYYEVDSTHPLVTFVRDQRDRLKARRDVGLLATTPIGTLRRRGGLCQYGTCGTTYEFYADGTWRLTQPGSETTGVYDPAPLLDAIRAVPWGSGSLGRFSGQCPTAYDGSETFYRALDLESLDVKIDLASCTDEIDPTNPVVIALDDASIDAQN